MAAVGDARLQTPFAAATAGSNAKTMLVHVLPKPGVMDPVALSTLRALSDLNVAVTNVRSLHKYWITNADQHQVQRLAAKVLANDSVDQVVIGPLNIAKLAFGSRYELDRKVVPIRNLTTAQLESLSREGQLYLTQAEMLTVQKHFQEMNREPTDIELETIAQTWSEHCSHKTLAGRIAYRDENGERHFGNMLKETIFAATVGIRKQLVQTIGASPFSKTTRVLYASTTNIMLFSKWRRTIILQPSSPMEEPTPDRRCDSRSDGDGTWSQAVCNTDIFCFAPPITDATSLPGRSDPSPNHHAWRGSRRPRLRQSHGDPTVNGAVYFDPRYLGNPLVYCGNVGILP